MEETGNWAIVELMGRKVVAGYAAKSEFLGKPMLRVDVPQTSAFDAYTQFYGESAIYCVTIVSEQVARTVAESHKINPISVYTPELITRQKYDEMLAKQRLLTSSDPEDYVEDGIDPDPDW